MMRRKPAAKKAAAKKPAAKKKSGKMPAELLERFKKKSAGRTGGPAGDKQKAVPTKSKKKPGANAAGGREMKRASRMASKMKKK